MINFYLLLALVVWPTAMESLREFTNLCLGKLEVKCTWSLPESLMIFYHFKDLNKAWTTLMDCNKYLEAHNHDQLIFVSYVNLTKKALKSKNSRKLMKK